MVSLMCRIGAFAPSFPVRTWATPRAMACTSVSHLSARATPRPRTLRAVAVQAVTPRPQAPGAQLLVLVRERADDRRAISERPSLAERDELVKLLRISGGPHEIAEERRMRPRRAFDRALEDREADAGAVAHSDMANGLRAGLFVLPLIAEHDRIDGRPRGPHRGHDLRHEVDVLGLERPEAQHHPLRFRRPV